MEEWWSNRRDTNGVTGGIGLARPTATSGNDSLEGDWTDASTLDRPTALA